MNWSLVILIVSGVLALLLAGYIREVLFVKYNLSRGFSSHRLANWPRRRDNTIAAYHCLCASVGAFSHSLAMLGLNHFRIAEGEPLQGAIAFAAGAPLLLLTIYLMHGRIRERYRAIEKIYLDRRCDQSPVLPNLA